MKVATVGQAAARPCVSLALRPKISPQLTPPAVLQAHLPTRGRTTSQQAGVVMYVLGLHLVNGDLTVFSGSLQHCANSRYCERNPHTDSLTPREWSN